ncbi:MAG: GNAT family N-acetyltransferase [Elusimicrobiales bacterium]|nr:GNAT family N-acetyltransferase [Elusimicrobiales bacterium]
MNFSIKTIKNPDLKILRQIKEIYKDAGWWDNTDNINRLAKIVKGSHIFVVAVHQNKIVAMPRAISDKVNDAYIQDFAVLKEFRNKGIGTEILNFIKDFLIKKEFKWIGLISEKKAVSLYKRHGFKIFKEKTPMIYEFKKTGK